ncbi:hypothetical protein CS542_02080 [Pedobacter sp. IW39]|nr:hypothetical protein CS542_02080 [Pedobacter sp. IW39]
MKFSSTKIFMVYKGAINATFDKYKDFRTPVPEYNFRTNLLATTLDLGSVNCSGSADYLYQHTVT